MATDDDDFGSALERADDAFIVTRARDGDLRAFATLLRRHEGVLRRYVDRLTRNRADTDDVLQETAVLAWRNLDSLADPARVRPWLIQIATREALRVVVGRRHHDDLSDAVVVVGGPDDDIQHVDLRDRLQTVLDGLPQQQAQCWVLREIGGYSYAEIAERLSVPQSTVRGSLAQARKTIVTRMGGRR